MSPFVCDWGDINCLQYRPGSAPRPGEVYEPAALVTLTFTPSSRDFEIFAYDLVGESDYLYYTDKPTGEFNSAMTSLPDSPLAYQISDPSNAEAGIVASGPFGSFDASWERFGGFGLLGMSHFAVIVRNVDGPPAEPCPGDLNGDGTLDFFDVSVFISLFNQGCP